MTEKIYKAESWRLSIYQFPNGMVAVTGGQGQIPELQGHYREAIPNIIDWLTEKYRKMLVETTV